MISHPVTNLWKAALTAPSNHPADFHMQIHLLLLFDYSNTMISIIIKHEQYKVECNLD